MATSPITVHPDVGIPDLIRRLVEDSKRLAADEVQLAKIEARDGLHSASRGVLWAALAFGAGTVMSMSLTIFLITAIGRAANGHIWIGALVTGLLEIGVGGLLVKRGLAAAVTPSYSLEETRHNLTDTARWTASVRH